MQDTGRQELLYHFNYRWLVVGDRQYIANFRLKQRKNAAISKIVKHTLHNPVEKYIHMKTSKHKQKNYLDVFPIMPISLFDGWLRLWEHSRWLCFTGQLMLNHKKIVHKSTSNSKGQVGYNQSAWTNHRENFKHQFMESLSYKRQELSSEKYTQRS